MIKIMFVLINKDRDKPKRSAFKCPTLHIPNVLGVKNSSDTNITIPTLIEQGQVLFIEVSLENGNYLVQKIIKK